MVECRPETDKETEQPVSEKYMFAILIKVIPLYTPQLGVCRKYFSLRCGVRDRDY